MCSHVHSIPYPFLKEPNGLELSNLKLFLLIWPWTLKGQRAKWPWVFNATLPYLNPFNAASTISILNSLIISCIHIHTFLFQRHFVFSYHFIIYLNHAYSSCSKFSTPLLSSTPLLIYFLFSFNFNHTLSFQHLRTCIHHNTLYLQLLFHYCIHIAHACILS